ncbi:flagellar export protein FliJ [Actinotalea sp. M2MS4P-6]|uniref:flagellar export protein FliJ n=1 Tax=Actinotalea sp. M2MS4P-6 TaxID=2983762 RepID=UPI0021E47920|nr:flagellar export protein FliJ [Actinotalea sp. M2MS4P-6]MCV2392786.1 flagellar export protein FliJ [Actinotalea sp. M2MS4P-6]
MSRPFRLGALLRLRQLEEERAAASLAAANVEVREAEDERAELVSLMSGVQFPSRVDDAVWRTLVVSRASLHGLVNEASAVVDVATRRSELATADWTAARTRLAMVDKLADRHAVTVRAEEEKAEQLVLDEAASRRGTAAGTEEER